MRKVPRRFPELRIEDFTPADSAAFRDLNLDWIRRYFKVEKPDRILLANPQRGVLAQGGHILMARVGARTIGTCALLHHGEGVFELAKMGVDEHWQGLGIGKALLRAAIARFRSVRGRSLFLETNSKLTPAIALYRKAGFVAIPAPRPSKYSRADYVMEYRPRKGAVHA